MTPFIEDRSVLLRPAPAADSIVRYGALDENIAEVRYAKDASSLGPLIIFIHGGFWRPQFDRAHAGPLCAAIAAAGWTIASIEYRRIPGNADATLQDVSRAIESLPALVKEHRGKSIVAGHSAGGHLALCAATKFGKDILSGALALAPVADLHYAELHSLGDRAVQAFLGGPVAERRDLDPCQLPSPTAEVTIVHGVQDLIVPLALSENYQARHAKTRLVKISACGHFAVIDPVSVAWPRVLEALRSLSPI